MLYDLGYFALLIAFVLANYAAAAAVFGAQTKRLAFVESARNAALLIVPLLTLDVLLIVYALVALDMRLAYVYDVSGQAMNWFLRVTALWGGQAGSILFWGWLMAGLSAVVIYRKWKPDQALMPYVIFVTMGTLAFFLGLSLFISNPFARLWLAPGAQEVTTATFCPAGALPYIPA